MYCFIRHILASLHFNENVHRECQTSKDGTPYMKVTYPKFKLGDEVVREVAVPPTYGEYDFKYLLYFKKAFGYHPTKIFHLL